jgi:hypothetical protein
MDNGQKTPCGHPDFNSYVKIQRVFIDNGQTNRRTDEQTNGRTDREINPVWAGTPTACGLEELFFRCLKKVSPAHQRSAGLWYIVQEFGW